MAVLTDLKSLVVSAGVNTSIVFRDFVPPTPDVVVVLQGYPGGDAGLQEVFGTTVGSITVLPHRVQVLVRGVSTAGGHDAAATLADTVWAAVYGVEVDINGHRYHRITPVQAPFFLERDDSRRPVLAWNVEVLARH